MKSSLMSHLHPVGADSSELRLQVFETSDDGEIVEGAIFDGDDRWFPVLNGVPSFLEGVLRPDLSAFAAKHGLTLLDTHSRESAGEQAKTTETFSDKWSKFKQYGLNEKHQEFLMGWYQKKFGLSSQGELESFFADRKRILECGPGSGFNSRFMAQHSAGEVFALDVSEAAFTTYENTCDLPNCSVVQADLMDAPFPNEYFDFIIADGVLHHTPNTRAAVEALYEKLAPGGQFFFYVYRKLGAARVFVDEHIRAAFTKMEPEECYAACEGLTELGRELSRLDARIELNKPIPSLGIPAGEHDVQRLLYYNFVKCFWNDAFDFETNNMVNFDWYHPHNAWQHTDDEVKGWLREMGVTEFTFNDANPNGISVLLTKPSN